MKKVLIGICGIGNGHINRQKCVIEELLNKNYNVIVATENNKVDVLKKSFPNLKTIEIDIPWIVCNEKGFDYKETLKKYNNIDIYKRFLEFGNKLEKEFKGKPDLVISDYEPNVAKYAYSQDIPLITMEQQSKFMYLKEIELKNQSIKEEIYRLNYFFPKYYKKIISSFFPLNIKDKNIIQVPPIISNLKSGETRKDFIVIYLSPYSNSKKYIKLLNILKNIKNKKFKVYSKNSNVYKEKYLKIKNIEFVEFNEGFKEDLKECEALITTGGHQLISEAIFLEKPLYIMPLETYEQNYNGYMVNKYKLGTNEEFSFETINNFLNNLKYYSSNIKKYKKKYYKKDWKEIFNEVLKKI